MTYDCFTFFNELDVLDIRLHELDPVVDRFVIVESQKTFTNIDKPLYFQENRHRFSPFLGKIIHVVADPFEGDNKHWEREAHQRNEIMKGLRDAQPDDTILIGDVDEIPKADTVRANRADKNPVVFELFHTYGFLDLFFGMWRNGTRMARLGSMQSPQQTRLGSGRILNKSGWHFAYLGDPEHIARKLRSFSHVEWDRPPYNDPEHIAREMAQGRTMVGDLQGTRLPENRLPEYVRNHPEKFKGRLCPAALKTAGPKEMSHVT